MSEARRPAAEHSFGLAIKVFSSSFTSARAVPGQKLRFAGLPSVSQAASATKKPRRPRGPAEASPRAVVPDTRTGVRGKPAAWLRWSGVRSAGRGRTKASSRASYGKRGLPDGASVSIKRVGRGATGCPGAPFTTRRDDGGHGPAPHPVLEAERLAHYHECNSKRGQFHARL